MTQIPTVMLTTKLLPFFSIIHDPDLDKLSILIIILSLTLITILVLLTKNLIKTRRLKAENKKLKEKINL